MASSIVRLGKWPQAAQIWQPPCCNDWRAAAARLPLRAQAKALGHLHVPPTSTPHVMRGQCGPGPSPSTNAMLQGGQSGQLGHPSGAWGQLGRCIGARCEQPCPPPWPTELVPLGSTLCLPAGPPLKLPQQVESDELFLACLPWGKARVCLLCKCCHKHMFEITSHHVPATNCSSCHQRCPSGAPGQPNCCMGAMCPM